MAGEWGIILQREVSSFKKVRPIRKDPIKHLPRRRLGATSNAKAREDKTKMKREQQRARLLW